MTSGAWLTQWLTRGTAHYAEHPTLAAAEAHAERVVRAGASHAVAFWSEGPIR